MQMTTAIFELQIQSNIVLIIINTGVDKFSTQCGNVCGVTAVYVENSVE